VNKVFLSYSFRPANDQIVRQVDRLIRSHGLLPVTGEVLGGEGLTPEVQALIAQSDALVCLLTRDKKIQNRKSWIPTDWVRDEFKSARNRKQLAIALVETGVKIKGMFAENEYIPFDRAAQCEALIKLSQTIGRWKEMAGRSLEIRLLPDAAAQMASQEHAKCQYRLTRQLEKPGDWKEGRVARRPGGVFLIVPGAKLDELIEVRVVEGDAARWRSDEAPQWVHVELRNVLP